MESIPDYLYLEDAQGLFVKVNRAAARWLGLDDPRRAIGKNLGAFLGPEYAREALVKEREVVSTGAPLVAIEERVTTSDGRTTWLSTTRVAIHDAKGRTVGLFGVSRDITRQKADEERTHTSQKLEAIGRLAGGVAHDFNNLLGVIIGYGERVAARLPEDDSSRSDQLEVLKAAHRAAELTRQLLAFGRKQVLLPRLIDLNAVVRDMQAMLARVVGEDCELTTRMVSAPATIWADPGQTSQVILNLAANARDAMPSGGRLTIETKVVDVSVEASAAIQMSLRPGRYVVLAVRDTGVGMGAEAMKHVFEPFFTTKRAGKGTGLGLATVYGIVKQSGGFIWVDSEVGLGSTFKVYFPLREGSPESLGDRLMAPTQRGGGETVLVVEDEETLRSIVHETLEENGYRVLGASDGAQALQVVDEHAGRIHLVVTDVVMPGMSGREMVDAILKTRPEVRTLFVSGYAREALGRRGDLGPGAAFLSKPFTAAALLEKCRELLNE